jgi:hypothetical protein
MAMDFNGGASFGELLAEMPRYSLGMELDSRYEITRVLPSLFGQPIGTQRTVQAFQRIKSEALDRAVDNGIGLVYTHFPTPHSPFIYDSKAQNFDLNTYKPSGYLQNLALVDRTVAELRQRLESAGLWDSTTVLLMSDHSFRESGHVDGKTDPRTPFILKMAGSHEAVQLDFPFNTLLTKELVLAILRKEVSTAREAAQWIQGQAERQAPELRTRTFTY